MKKFFSLIIFVLSASLLASALNFQDESLDYKVMFKWGLINKKAGDVNISLKNQNGVYNCELTAKSAPWADGIYKVRDTLRCDIAIEGFLPLRYEKISHEDVDYKHDVVEYRRSGATTIGQCKRYAERKGKVRKDETRTLEAEGTTVDMLSAFYYLRHLDFKTWALDQTTSINIFSGKRKELLTFKYLGIEDVKCEKITYQAYKIAFIFTSEGGKRTSDDMWAWVDVKTGIPVKLEGKLPVGSVKCFYLPKQ